MIHDRFEIDHWTRLFPLSKLRAEARAFVESRRRELPEEYPNERAVERHVKLMCPSGEIVTSPLHIAVVEQLRSESLNGGLPKHPTDVFIFARGEPSNPCCTKVGGIPFWPAERKWPANSDGAPMGFIAQFCFADSIDLFPNLPGDILLIFANASYKKYWMPSQPADLHFVWIKSRETIPMKVAEIPSTSWHLEPFYGQIHRTFDFLTGSILDREWWSLLMKQCKRLNQFWSGLIAGRTLEKRYHQSWRIPIIEGTKIGGIPGWVQCPEKIPGRFLCALGSVHPAYQTSADDPLHRPYPFVNLAQPIVRTRGAFVTVDETVKLPTDQLLMWGDVGSVFLFLDDKGEIHWTCQCG